MEFLKMNKLRKALKPDKEVKKKEIENEGGDVELGKSEDEDDDDFIMNEVKRRLKELRKNSFMVLIPEEESCAVEEEEEEETEEGEANEWRDVEEEGRRLWSCFGAFYDKYCDRMLYFDRHLLKQIPHGSEDDLETSYVSQLCLTWEALHCQYTQLATAETCKSYNQSAQQFQQFQVLLQRFIENEPFQPGFRPQIYAHARNAFPKLLQVPNIEESGGEEEESVVRAQDLIRIIESSILTFHVFIKMDRRKKKKKSNGVRNLFGGQGQNQMAATPLQQVQSSLDKRKVKLKELWKKRKGGKKNEWPATQEEAELLLGLIDVKVMARVLRMVKITKEQLFWTEEKMKKLHLSGKLQRDPSPILFPC